MKTKYSLSLQKQPTEVFYKKVAFNPIQGGVGG